MNNDILSIARKTIELESNAIANLTNLIDSNFENAIKCILKSKGRVIITGIGKSAAIATKIVATLNSTGTPSIFMHAADAIHGDLGIVQEDDVVICISKSGNTPEIKVLIPLIKRNNNPIIAITGNKDSFLGTQATYVLNTYVEKEACPNNLAPTTSTTAQLVMGDAIAVTLLELNQFTSKDFAKYHPGGALGKKLYLRVSDLVSKNEMPKVEILTNMKDTLLEISNKRLGATAVLENNTLVGIITDGDIRRMLNVNEDFIALTAKDIMSKSPKTIHIDAMAVEAMYTMENNNISQLIAIDDAKNYKGIIHIHDLIKEGIF
ncbi:SIS domain-containing protein [Wenyingzhuangia sp. 2_MG-2023]|uniref:KpsF/GutQ family sugar-phosphate isomerase n=1 Tax=Wenyingzhuangia sp. 2_MG-2023 TaxID=3062639 RepID=UPI0026E19335|nr:KpsF/GutQ family sugar-phosphate isomerase [Wenyingzhuangia sp. 2_MG-2023]MDO6738894.1 KpsF/GutQ family sugar-phosphate isomerase [Wenyingzhuangia sp. 2_MG-2023]